MTWRTHLTPAEAERIAKIEAMREQAVAMAGEYRAIYNRCMKRRARKGDV